MAFLDLLYLRILSKVPAKVRGNTRQLLLALIAGWKPLLNGEGRNFIVLCNWLGMTYDEAYAALRPLKSVLYAPGRDKAHKRELRYFHKSFIDYISDFARSGFCMISNAKLTNSMFEVRSGSFSRLPMPFDVGAFEYMVNCGKFVGRLARGPGIGGNISLTWHVDEESGWDDTRTSSFIYNMAIANVVSGIKHREQAFCTVFWIRALATRFEVLSDYS
jgi:hypothetical protein